MRIIPLIAGLAFGTSAQANMVTVTFADGAPKDRISLTNDGCPLSDTTIVFDLRDTPAGLIFDVTAAGAGVEVYQPVEVTAGSIAVSPVADGGQVLHMQVADFPRGATLALSADLDDTVSTRQITVSGSEMIGAAVSVSHDGQIFTATFDATGTAVVDVANAGCPIT